MAKINATYSSGYYLAPDTDYRKLEEEQKLELRRKRRLEKRDDGSGTLNEGKVIRQTFAIPFNIICLHCNRRIARGTHGYVNRRPTENKYMGIRIWELEFRCIFCKGHIYLITDYETAKITGGYHCGRNCRRGEGDFYGMNQINEDIRAKQAEKAAEKGSLDALEMENETVRRLQETERLVEELVGSRANTVETQIRDDLLHAIQTRKKSAETDRLQQQEKNELRVTTSGLDTNADGGEETDDDDYEDEEEEEEKEYRRFEKRLRDWNKKKEEEEEERLKNNADVNDEVAAIITAKYSSNEKKGHNVFVDDSDIEQSDDGDKDESVVVSNKEDCSLPLPVKQSYSTSAVAGSAFSKACRGGVLALLLDD